MSDMLPRKQIGGSHYNQYDIQPFDVIDEVAGEHSWVFYFGNALKYLMRYKSKGGILDLEKAKHYIEILIKKERSPDGGNLPEASEGGVREVPPIRRVEPVRADVVPARTE
jgi:hypothetical protein